MDKNNSLLKQVIAEGFNQRIDDVLSARMKSTECSKNHTEAMKAILAGKVTGSIVWTTKARRIVALLVAALLLLTSCAVIYREEIYCYVTSLMKNKDYFPEGYTGGWKTNPESYTEYYWVETYEECQAAIELLKSHGSTFYPTVIFTCEDDSFDVKYCFEMNRTKSESIHYGENPFNRRVYDVYITSVGFYDEVTIDELVYSSMQNYNALGFNSINRDLLPSLTILEHKMIINLWENCGLKEFSFVPRLDISQLRNTEQITKNFKPSKEALEFLAQTKKVMFAIK